MDIKEFQKYPKAWSEFNIWIFVEAEYDYSTLRKAPCSRYIRHLLADLQAWLDSVGIRAYYVPYHQDLKYRGQVMTKTFQSALQGLTWASVMPENKHTNAPEALYAAIEKGLSIFESQTKLKNS